MKPVTIAIACRIYNEINIISDFINHYKNIADAGFYFYDDGSDDGTYEFLNDCESVKKVIKGQRTKNNITHNIQNTQRNKVVLEALKNLNDEDYILLLDCDEFVYFSEDYRTFNEDVIFLNLFDMYITPDDVDKYWSEREMFGPEWRQIDFMVKKKHFKNVIFHRTFTYKTKNITKKDGGYVKHIGKGLSIDHWERKCNFYTSEKIIASYVKKWESRKGKAIHTKSDFNRPLYKWDELINNRNLWVKIS